MSTITADIARKQGATAAKVDMAWVIDDDTIPCKQVIAHGRHALGLIADRYEFCVLDDQWTVDGAFLRVQAEVIYWPAGVPVDVALFDDVASGVPS